MLWLINMLALRFLSCTTPGFVLVHYRSQLFMCVWERESGKVWVWFLRHSPYQWSCVVVSSLHNAQRSSKSPNQTEKETGSAVQELPAPVWRSYCYFSQFTVIIVFSNEPIKCAFSLLSGCLCPHKVKDVLFPWGCEGYLEGFVADGMWCKTKDVFHVNCTGRACSLWTSEPVWFQHPLTQP